MEFTIKRNIIIKLINNNRLKYILTRLDYYFQQYLCYHIHGRAC